MAQACNLMKLSRSPLAKPQVGDSQHSGLVCVVNNNSSITIGFMMVSRCSKHVNYNYSFLEFTNQLYLKKKNNCGAVPCDFSLFHHQSRSGNTTSQWWKQHQHMIPPRKYMLIHGLLGIGYLLQEYLISWTSHQYQWFPVIHLENCPNKGRAMRPFCKTMLISLRLGQYRQNKQIPLTRGQDS